MGQAKQRGTYEERKKLAVKKKAEEQAAYDERIHMRRLRRPSPKLSKSSMMMIASVMVAHGVDFEIM